MGTPPPRRAVGYGCCGLSLGYCNFFSDGLINKGRLKAIKSIPFHGQRYAHAAAYA